MNEQWGEWYRGILFVMTWEMKDESGKGLFFNNYYLEFVDLTFCKWFS